LERGKILDCLRTPLAPRPDFRCAARRRERRLGEKKGAKMMGTIK